MLSPVTSSPRQFSPNPRGPMLIDFIAKLHKEYPEARLELTDPAKDDAEAFNRLESLCAHYAAVVGCSKELAEEAAYMVYMRTFADVFGGDPEKSNRLLTKLMAGVL